ASTCPHAHHRSAVAGPASHVPPPVRAARASPISCPYAASRRNRHSQRRRASCPASTLPSCSASFRAAGRSASPERRRSGPARGQIKPASHTAPNTAASPTRSHRRDGALLRLRARSRRRQRTIQLSLARVGVRLLLQRTDLFVVEAEMVRDLVDQHVSNNAEQVIA